MKITVAVVTKNRCFDLIHCLSSLINQSKKIFELIIINNNSSDQTVFVVRNLARKVKISLRVINEKASGYAAIYNRALNEARGDWIVFLDDDCLADGDWYHNYCLAINDHQEAAAIMGKTLAFKKSFWSLVTVALEDWWKFAGIEANKIINFEVLDNKNLAYNLKYLKFRQLKFNQQLTVGNGASEDADLGMKIFYSGGKAFYNSKILAWHKYSTDLIGFWKKILGKTKAHQDFKERWQIKHSAITYLKNFGKFWYFFKHDYQLSKLEQIELVTAIFFIFLIKKIIVVYEKIFRS